VDTVNVYATGPYCAHSVFAAFSLLLSRLLISELVIPPLIDSCKFSLSDIDFRASILEFKLTTRFSFYSKIENHLRRKRLRKYTIPLVYVGIYKNSKNRCVGSLDLSEVHALPRGTGHSL
jgi:hypothetical protein